MLIPGKYTNITSIVHKQTPIQFGSGPDGALYYSILLTDPADERGRWKDAQALTFPTEFRDVDSDLIKPLAATPGTAPAQVLSDGKYVYVFRLFSDGVIYVDRFVPEIVNATLNRTYDVRKRTDGTYGHADLNGVTFYEPTIRLKMLSDVRGGSFAVLQVPTSRPGVNRWQFFLLMARDKIRNVSIRCSADGLFDLTDLKTHYTPRDPKGQRQKTQDLVVRAVTDMALRPQGANVVGGLNAARFHKHDAVTVAGTTQTLRTDLHVLLAFATDAAGAVAVADFEVGKDGTLADPREVLQLPKLGPPWAMQAQQPDRNGLVVSTGLLTFAQSVDTPFVLDSSDGFVHLYFRGLANQYLVAFYDTLHGTWIDQANSLAAQVKNSGDWVSSGSKTALADVELLFLAPGGYAIWQYNPLVTGFRDGSRHADQNFPGRAIVAGIHVEYFSDGKLGGSDAVPALVAGLPQCRILFLSDNGGYQFVQYDQTVAAGQRDGWSGSGAFPGKVIVSGIHAEYFARGDEVPAFAIALDQGRLLFLGRDGGYAVWACDATATGLRDGWQGQGFPGTIVVSGNGPGFFQRTGASAPAAVAGLGNNRFILLSGDAYEVWQYDPSATGFREGSRGVGFPGSVIVSGMGAGFFGRPQTGGGKMTAAMGIGPNRFFILDDSTAYQVWQYDPTVTGFRDGTRGTAPGFPGTLMVHGIAPGFFDNRFTSGNAPIGIACLGAAAIDKQPSVIEQSAIATDDSGNILKDDKDNLQGAMYRWYANVSHGTAASATRVKVEDLRIDFVDTNIADASLLGYIEGPPPIPLENVPDGTGGLSAALNRVTFTVADGMTNGWTWTRDAGIDLKADMEAGGTGFGWKVTAKASIDTSYGFLDGRDENSNVSLVTTRLAELEGTPQNGSWVPYNYGMAYLSGLTVNIYALRLKGNDRVVGYQQVISSDQLAQQEVRFLINPSYTKQGTLDGMVGLKPDPDYPHAAEKRSGNSYFKPDEAEKFAAAIELEAKQREAFYSQYNADAFSSLSQDDRNGMTQRSLISSCQWRAPGGLQVVSETVTNVTQTSSGGSFKFVGMMGESAEYAPPAGTPGASFKQSIMFGGHLLLTAKKSETATTSFGLAVNVEIREDVISTPSGAPVPPGTRVQGYDFTTFYLEESPDHFTDFFARVVDPLWLNGPNGDSRNVNALRDALNRPKSAWRIVHRVTSVDRGEQDAEGGG